MPYRSGKMVVLRADMLGLRARALWTCTLTHMCIMMASAAPSSWKPSVPSAAMLVGEMGSKWPACSARVCVGTTARTRTCQFKDLVYDKKLGEFLYVSRNATELQHPSIQPNRKNREYINLGISPLTTGKGFTISFANQPFPPLDKSCRMEYPVYLHKPYQIDGFGHLLRDNINIMLNNLLRLGLQDRHYKLLLTLPAVPHVVSKYFEFAATGVETWAAELERCSKRYVVFRELVAGHGSRDLRWEGTRPELCAAQHFQVQRAVAYSIANIPLSPLSKSSPIKVLLCDKQPSDKRRINNIQELVPALQARFPEFTIQSRVFAHMEPREQLQLLSDTSILISPIGSMSFRLMYLPDGAHVILVGAPERADGKFAGKCFREVDECWRHLGYVTIDRYHLTDESEWVTRYKRDRWAKSNLELYEEFMWWDSDSHLNVDKLAALIEKAAESIRSTQSSR